MKYIIQFEEGVYKASWYGDPGRTTKKQNAEVFENRHDAQRALNISLYENQFRTWKNPLVIKINNHIN
jgi:hypothetical protein